MLHSKVRGLPIMQLHHQVQWLPGFQVRYLCLDLLQLIGDIDLILAKPVLDTFDLISERTVRTLPA